jgi:hypothetical protein
LVAGHPERKRSPAGRATLSARTIRASLVCNRPCGSGRDVLTSCSRAAASLPIDLELLPIRLSSLVPGLQFGLGLTRPPVCRPRVENGRNVSTAVGKAPILNKHWPSGQTRFEGGQGTARLGISHGKCVSAENSSRIIGDE